MLFFKKIISLVNIIHNTKKDYDKSLNEINNSLKEWSIDINEKSKQEHRKKFLEIIENLKKESKITTTKDIRLLLDKKISFEESTQRADSRYSMLEAKINNLNNNSSDKEIGDVIKLFSELFKG